VKNKNSKVKIMTMHNTTFELEEPAKPFKISHRCFYFSKEVILFIRNSKYERIHHSLFDQLLRSATSIGANIVEGKSGSSKKDWKNYYSIALKSANETKYWLCLMSETLDLPKAELKKLLDEANELSKIIATIIVNANKSNQS
jgi:four helix bundle protein